MALSLADLKVGDDAVTSTKPWVLVNIQTGFVVWGPYDDEQTALHERQRLIDAGVARDASDFFAIPIQDAPST